MLFLLFFLIVEVLSANEIDEHVSRISVPELDLAKSLRRKNDQEVHHKGRDVRSMAKQHDTELQQAPRPNEIELQEAPTTRGSRRRRTNREGQDAEGTKLVLEKVVLLMRHGIRSPYPSMYVGVPSYNNFSKDGRYWPESAKEWGTLNGIQGSALTIHGAEVLKQMGAFYRSQIDQRMQRGDNSTLCREIAFYADIDETGRCMLSGQSFLKGFGCSSSHDMPTAFSDINFTNLLFNQGNIMLTHPDCQLPSRALVNGAIGGDASTLVDSHRWSIMRLNHMINCCQPEAVCQNCSSSLGKTVSQAYTQLSSTCTLLDLPICFNAENFWSFFSGPLGTAAEITEYFQMAYLNNMTKALFEILGCHIPTDGSFDVGTCAPLISNLMTMHISSLYTTDNFWMAQRFGSELAVHILRSMQQMMDGWIGGTASSKRRGGTLPSPSNWMTFYAGHDVNIAFIRHFLGASWVTHSFNQNELPPGGMIIFELMRSMNSTSLATEIGNFFVKMYFMSQS
eukprot:gnl/MRDRNA2_/MRDRNA2_75767_c0_seq1.p1 gnl/MRDRNA2_/MRDRNA2_75767_c0~~gnl/MRDRNA2_/MRDRNA2_75767_c0_seq1.p1  ORF type:complete len:509 (-),score=63.80 gnl/MRDRNA2_/MRDRNA2_75767_c0_seq1:37-1563(-)